jgi:hypothetical protein
MLGKLMREKRGQILVEAMIALSIALISITGFLSLLSQSLSVNTFVGHQYTATYLASEGIEIVKNITDKKFESSRSLGSSVPMMNGITSGNYEVSYDSSTLFPVAGSGRRLKFDGASARYQYSAGADTPFVRTVQIEDVRGDGRVMKVVSTVRWQTKGISFAIVLEDYSYYWWEEV